MGKRFSITGPQAKELRQKFKLTQYEFWTPLDVMQSGASRYESGRSVPKPVQQLIGARYCNRPIATYQRVKPVAAKPKPPVAVRTIKGTYR
jgi:hypothetical protein